MDEYGLAAFIFGAGLAIIFLFLAYVVVAYVLTALGLQKLADRKGIENSWLAWIPYANMYILGLLVKEKSKIPYIEWILLGGSLGLTILGSLLGPLGPLLGLAFLVISIMSYYELYKMYSKSYVLLIILSVIFAFLIPFFVFAIRNNEEIV